jgi:hypothetical protein
MTLTKPQLNVVHDNRVGPPRPLGPAGTSMWSCISSEYSVDDEAARQLLWLACDCEDRRSQLALAIARDGAVVTGRYGPRSHPAIREESSCRSFIAKTLERLGLNVESIKSPGRPSSGGLGIINDWGK